MSIGIGLSLPLALGQNGYFESTYNILEQSKSNLTNLILTRRGERVMNPEFGCQIHEILFDPMSSDYQDKVQQEVESAVAQWLPYLLVQDIGVTMDESNRTTTISVTFSLINSPTITDSIIVDIGA